MEDEVEHHPAGHDVHPALLCLMLAAMIVPAVLTAAYLLTTAP